MIRKLRNVWPLLFILCVGCGSDDESMSDNQDCRGACPTSADLADSEAACAELGAGNAYCFKQNGTLDTAVTCTATSTSLLACLNNKTCSLNADNSEATCN